MKWEELSNLTPDNGAIKDLKELIIAEVFTDPVLEQFFTLMYNVHNGDKVGYVGAMSDVGWAGDKCNPEYKKATIAFLEERHRHRRPDFYGLHGRYRLSCTEGCND